jgi:acylphosphatase
MRRVNVIISGMVQGIGFRWATREEATERGLAGWVTNLADGRVEAEVEGEDAAVERMLVWLGRGPYGARVSGTEVVEREPAGESGFRIRR